MLTKAILTGGVLSVLAGSIVYFGTEGADALESDARGIARVEETELAGAADEAVGEVDLSTEVTEVEVQDPPKETSKPKTKWLDQYLKKSKPDTKPQPKPAPEVIEADAVQVEIEAEAEADNDIMPEEKKIIRVETQIERDGARGEAKGTYIVAEGDRVETLDIRGLDLDALSADGDVDVEALIEELGLDTEKNVQIRVVKKMDRTPSRFGPSSNLGARVDYDKVLTEAKKLLVTDMRNQAFLEIIDHAIDQDDVMQAADIVDDLSTPELRDTARARIGVGLARRGDTDAAFAVLEELEIDELSAPIRLEIITALMATRAERINFVSQ